MPRREDERYRNLSSKHPEACTCKDCNDRSLKKQGIKPGGLLRKKAKPAERVKRHPAGCTCASCNLLGSIDFSSTKDRRKGGFFKGLFGKR